MAILFWQMKQVQYKKKMFQMALLKCSSVDTILHCQFPQDVFFRDVVKTSKQRN